MLSPFQGALLAKATVNSRPPAGRAIHNPVRKLATVTRSGLKETDQESPSHILRPGSKAVSSPVSPSRIETSLFGKPPDGIRLKLKPLSVATQRRKLSCALTGITAQCLFRNE